MCSTYAPPTCGVPPTNMRSTRHGRHGRRGRPPRSLPTRTRPAPGKRPGLPGIEEADRDKPPARLLLYAPARAIVVHEPKLESGQVGYDQARADVDLHARSVRKAEDPRRGHE